MTVRHTRPYGFVSKVPASFPVLPLEKAKAYEALAKRRGASKVARSSRGIFAAFTRAGGHVTTMGKDPQFGQDWGRRRRAFLKRHMAQIVAKREPLFNADGTPTNRHLALIMWAYSPKAGQL